MPRKKNNNNTKLGNIIVKIKSVHNSLDYNQEIIIENIDLFSSKKYFSITQQVINNKVYYNAYIDDVGNKIEIKESREINLVFFANINCGCFPKKYVAYSIFKIIII